MNHLTMSNLPEVRKEPLGISHAPGGRTLKSKRVGEKRGGTIANVFVGKWRDKEGADIPVALRGENEVLKG